MVSSGGGLGRVRLTLRSSELCCRAASWGDGERERETGRREKGGWESRMVCGRKDVRKGFWEEKKHMGQLSKEKEGMISYHDVYEQPSHGHRSK